jgi:hypothetical protein
MKSFVGSSFENVVIDESNPHYFVSGDFIVAFDGMRLIRYFGHSENVIICREIQAVGGYCFHQCNSVATVAFEPDSQLTIFGECAFSHCSALKSIRISAQVERISAYSFSQCSSLVEVAFEQGSKLTRIDREAFLDCHSLRSFTVPAQLEILQSDVFTRSNSVSISPHRNSLSQLIFEVPSRLTQLHLPMDDFVSLCIPDSIEVLTGLLRTSRRHDSVLQFDRESQLIRISLSRIDNHFRWRGGHVADVTVFVRLSEGTMRRLRSDFEAF